VDAVLKDITIETKQINKDGMEVKSNTMTSFYKGYLMAFLLSMTTLIYSMNVALCLDRDGGQRSGFSGVVGRIPFPAYCAHHHDAAHGFADATSVAIRGLHRPFILSIWVVL
jgi:hypothetical protein